MPKEDIQENHDVAEEATEQTVEPSAEKPPWEKDGEEFDAARAWKLIQNLRAENTKLKEKPEAEPTKAPEEPTKEEKPQEETKTPEDSNLSAELDAAKLENLKLRALASAGLDLDLLEFIPGSDSESIEENIKTLKSKIDAGESKKSFPVNPAQGGKSDSNPKEDWLKTIFG